MERIGVGERGAGAGDGGLGMSLHTGEGRRRGQDGATQLHNPEDETLEEVQTGDLALGAAGHLFKSDGGDVFLFLRKRKQPMNLSWKMFAIN